MSKTIAEVYEEVIKSAELQKEFLAAEQNGTIAALPQPTAARRAPRRCRPSSRPS